MDMTGKIAAVTGAASGIGKRAALLYAEHGAKVALIDINEDGAAQVARQIEDTGGEAKAFAADLSKPDDARRVIADIAAHFGRLDALANVAAIYPRASVLDATEEHWDKIMDLNVRGVFFTSQAAMKVMTEQKSGAIVNIASGAAFRPLENMVAYCTAKAGLLGMSRVLALEGAPHGVRVNTVAPGHTASETILTYNTRETLNEMAQELVSKRWLEPEEIAQGVVFLSSDAASGINGAILNINGGNFMP